MLGRIRNKRITTTHYKRFYSPLPIKTTPSATENIQVFVNGNPVSVQPGIAVIQACEQAGVEIPRFCYHDRLSVAGNCRMCLVELEKAPKPIASCAMPVMPNMKIKTDTPLVKKAREGVMEFLLSNHPLDCPICDQGGECDLQDQSMAYGSDTSRFNSHKASSKRAVEDKDLGPLVKTCMTRCIQCTRCVRFANEVAGAPELGTTGRGNDMQIGTYISKFISSEMSGNIIDLCPVGALTSKPYAFTARPWELKSTESIDVLDAVGSAIRVDSRGLEVMRILPRLNDDVNEEWISDKTRFAFDGLKRQRLTTPLRKVGNDFVAVTWKEALDLVQSEIKKCTNPKTDLAAIVGDLADTESMVLLRDLIHRLGGTQLSLDDSASTVNMDFRSNYVFNSTINGIEEADALLIVGCDPRTEAAVLNSRIRKGFLDGLEIGVVGDVQGQKMIWDYEHLGINLKEAMGNEWLNKFKSAKRPMVIVGSRVLEIENGNSVLKELSKFLLGVKALVTEEWNGFNVLQKAASWTAALDIGFTSHKSSQTPPKLVYLLNADKLTTPPPSNSFVIYQGHHGDRGALHANLILPGSAYTEKSATFVNTEGRVQVTRAAVAPPGSAREDWKIIRAVMEMVLPMNGKYETIEGVRSRMKDISPGLGVYDNVEENSFTLTGLQGLKEAQSSGNADVVLKGGFRDYYMTDVICRNSSTMAKCSLAFVNGKEVLDESIVAV